LTKCFLGAVIRMVRYKTILLDADETLLDFKRAEREALIAALTGHGVMPDEEMLATYSEINLATWKRLERGEITKTALRTARFADFCARYGLAINVELLAEDYLSALARQSFLLDGALDVCQSLAAHCNLYIITNGIASVQHGRFDHSPLAPYFKGTFISDEIGAEKPSSAFFDCVKAKIPDFDPATTLVVGDSLTSDIAGGIAAGLDTCWFDPAGKEIPQGMQMTYHITRLKELLPLALAL
jgi:2-haloacid dehalogenase